MISKSELLGRLERRRLIAVIRSKTAAEAIVTAEAAAEAGIEFVEITFSVPGATAVIRELAGREGMLVGAGTVLSREQAGQALEAGARFVVSPTLEPAVLEACREAGVTAVSGAATPTEILSGVRGGADLVKLFPADCVGGPRFVRQVRSTMPEVRLVISGGVALDNLEEYLRSGATGLVIGSAFLAETLAERGRAGLVRKVREFVEAVERWSAENATGRSGGGA
jgi:2-dehydro-3-deoxyphosphogluconate aldolase/(4S)-4-hydroxy-2-oxoglutarate aldolase